VPRLVILPATRADLIEIDDFIALDNPERALSFHPDLRAARYSCHLIFFVEAAGRSKRCRLLHGARDPPSTFTK
jgi:toxin ParE1/3/4